jgi:MFS family permease
MLSARLVAVVCSSQALAQVGAFAVAALLPTFIADWHLTNTQAGWIIGAFYAAYTLSVPVLVSMTDRVDPKRVYLASTALLTVSYFGYATVADGFWSAVLFRILAGVAWAGTYMPGLKALSDMLEGRQQSRAVAAHAGAVGVSGAFSFILAGSIADAFGWRWSLAIGGAGALLAFLLMAFLLPSQVQQPTQAAPRKLLNFGPVLRNRSALAYSLGYLVHTWEMSSLRSWVVAFLVFAAAHTGDTDPFLSPTAIATGLSLLGVWASVSGNEVAMRFGRRRFVFATMIGSMVLALLVGFSAAVSYELAALLCGVYGILIWADSSSLTAGTAGSANPGQRGATLAVHSMMGYAGGFLGPLVVGLVLDFSGGRADVTAWALAFGSLAVVMAIGPLALIVLKPRELPGDRPGSSAVTPTSRPT